MPQLIRYDNRNRVAIITVDNPSVNAPGAGWYKYEAGSRARIHDPLTRRRGMRLPAKLAPYRHPSNSAAAPWPPPTHMVTTP